MIYHRLFNQTYNQDILEFFKRNNIAEDTLERIPNNILTEPKEIDSIIEFKALYDEEESTKVSIADIIGYEYPKKKNIFASLNDFFDSKGDTYHSRSVDMLSYSSDSIIDSLSRSFIIEPIKVKEINNQFFIDGNGLHRFTILRIFYLLENNKQKLSLDEIRKKYTIPVIAKKLDKIKTYCAFLIELINENSYVRSDLDENYHKTGLVEIKQDNNTIKLTDEELIIYVTELLSKTDLDVKTLLRISRHYEINESFASFLKIHFQDIIPEIEAFIRYKNNCQNPYDIYDYNVSKKENKSL